MLKYISNSALFVRNADIAKHLFLVIYMQQQRLKGETDFIFVIRAFDLVDYITYDILHTRILHTRTVEFERVCVILRYAYIHTRLISAIVNPGVNS